MLALHGFEACGLEISQTAVAEAEQYASGEMREPARCNFGPAGRRRDTTSGTMKFVEADFFGGGWEAQGCGDGEGKFDLIYDYTVGLTFFCCLLAVTMADRCSSSVPSIHPSGGIGQRGWRPSLIKVGCLFVLSFRCIRTRSCRVRLGG